MIGKVMLAIVGPVYVSLAVRECWRWWKALRAKRANAQLLQRINDGSYRIPAEKAPQVMRDLMGVHAPEYKSDFVRWSEVRRQREWRERGGCISTVEIAAVVDALTKARRTVEVEWDGKAIVFKAVVPLPRNVAKIVGAST